MSDKENKKCKCKSCKCVDVTKISEEEFWKILNEKSTISLKRGANKNSKKIATHE